MDHDGDYHHHRSRRHDRKLSSPSSLGHKEFTLRELKEKARNEILIARRTHRDGRNRYREDNRSHWPRHSDKFANRRNQSCSQSPNDQKPLSGHHRSRHEHQKDDGGDGQFRRNHSRPDKKFNDNDDNKMKSPVGKPEIKPNFELTGALARDTNTFNGIVVKYNQPPEAKKPTKHWRLYPFKGAQPLDYISIHNQSAYLFGRERKVADIPIDHPSCSKQHAVIQFRSVPVEHPDGTVSKVTRPYIIDLDSANGTFVNYKKLEPRRYVELLERDVVKFGYSSREYVLLHEHSSANDECLPSKHNFF